MLTSPTSPGLLQSVTLTKAAIIISTDIPVIKMTATPAPTSCRTVADTHFVWPTLDLTRWPATATATPLPADMAQQAIEKSYAVIQTDNANAIHQIVRYHRFELEDDYWGKGHHQPTDNVAPDNMLDVAFSPKSYLLAFGSSNGPGVWDISKYLTQPWLQESRPINIVKKFSDNVWSGYTDQVAFSPDGQFIALGNPFDDPTIQIVKTSTLDALYPESLRPIFVVNFAFNPVAGTTMGLVGEGLEFWNWQGDCFFPERHFVLPAEYVPSEFDRYDNTSIAFSPDGKIVATGGVFTHKNKLGNGKNIIVLWDFATGKVINLFGDGENMGNIYSLSFNHAGNLLISGSGNYSFKPTDNGGKVRVWDVKSGTLLAALQADEDTTRIVNFSPDGNVIAAGNQDGTVKLWDAKTFQLLRTIRAHITKITGISFSFDGRFIASSSDDGTVGIWGVCANAHGQQDYKYPCK